MEKDTNRIQQERKAKSVFLKEQYRTQQFLVNAEYTLRDYGLGEGKLRNIEVRIETIDGRNSYKLFDIQKIETIQEAQELVDEYVNRNFILK